MSNKKFIAVRDSFVDFELELPHSESTRSYLRLLGGLRNPDQFVNGIAALLGEDKGREVHEALV